MNIGRRFLLVLLTLAVPGVAVAQQVDLRAQAGALAVQSGGETQLTQRAREWSPNTPTHKYPTLGGRSLGDAVTHASGDKKVWGHALPFMAQRVLDLGIDLPLPYGGSGIFGYIRQDLVLSNLQVSQNGSPMQSVPFVEFGLADVQDVTVQGRYDTWLFPFLNVFAIAGYIDGDGTIPIAVPVGDALEFLGLGRLCPDGKLRPQFCDDIVAGEALPVYQGVSVGFGGTLAMGYKRMFFTLPATYVYSDLDIIDGTIATLNFSLLGGVMLNPGTEGRGRFAVFAGANYLDAAHTITGSITFPLSQVDPSLEDQQFDYRIEEVNKNKWNFVTGFSYEFNHHWSADAQIGFLGSREEVILVGGYRF